MLWKNRRFPWAKQIGDGRHLSSMQYSHDQVSALLHELDVTGAEYRAAVQELDRTISKRNDVRASDPAFLAANQAAHLAQQRYHCALDAYKEHFRDKHARPASSNDAAMGAYTLHKERWTGPPALGGLRPRNV